MAPQTGPNAEQVDERFEGEGQHHGGEQGDEDGSGEVKEREEAEDRDDGRARPDVPQIRPRPPFLLRGLRRSSFSAVGSTAGASAASSFAARAASEDRSEAKSCSVSFAASCVHFTGFPMLGLASKAAPASPRLTTCRGEAILRGGWRHPSRTRSRSASGSARPTRTAWRTSPRSSTTSSAGWTSSSGPAGSPPTSRTGTGSGNFGFPVVATTCRYRAPVRFDDLLMLRTRVVRVEGSGATFGFSLFRTEAGKDILAAEGRITCRSIDASWSPIPLPAELKISLSAR